MQRVKKISPRAEQLASEYNLGNVTTEYGDSQMKVAWILLATSLPITILFVGIGLLNLYFRLLSPAGDWFMSLTESANSIVMPLIIGCVFIPISGISIVKLINTSRKGEENVYICENGFIYARRQVEIAARWDETLEIRRHIRANKTKTHGIEQITLIQSYTIFVDGQKKCSFVNEPGPTIEAAITTSLLPKTLTDYAAGKSISFNSLSIDRQCIRLTPDSSAKKEQTARTKKTDMSPGMSIILNKHILLLTDLELCWVDELTGKLILSKKAERKHWAALPLDQFSNIALYTALVEHILYADTHKIA